MNLNTLKLNLSNGADFDDDRLFDERGDQAVFESVHASQGSEGSVSAAFYAELAELDRAGLIF